LRGFFCASSERAVAILENIHRALKAILSVAGKNCRLIKRKLRIVLNAADQ